MTATNVFKAATGVANIILLGCSNGFSGYKKTGFRCLPRCRPLTSCARLAVDALLDPR